MTNENLEQRASMKERINAAGEGMIYLIMGGFGGAGTKVGAGILGMATANSNPVVVYGDGLISAAATLGCGALAVYCGLGALDKFKKAIKYKKIG